VEPLVLFQSLLPLLPLSLPLRFVLSLLRSLSLCHGVDDDPTPASRWVCLRRLVATCACVEVWIYTCLSTSLPTYLPTYLTDLTDPRILI
jgi:hypothetical protein